MLSEQQGRLKCWPAKEERGARVSMSEGSELEISDAE